MRNELEQLMMKHGAYWVVALVAVAISKMYSREQQTIKTVLRSLLAALVISFILVEQLAPEKATSTIFIYVFVTGILSDVIIEVIMSLGKKIKEDPSIIFKYLPWGNKK